MDLEHYFEACRAWGISKDEALDLLKRAGKEFVQIAGETDGS